MTLNAVAALEGTVVPVSADRNHNFNKRRQGAIVLVQAMALKATPTLGLSSNIDILLGDSRACPTFAKCISFPTNCSNFLGPSVTTCRQVNWARTSRRPVWSSSGCL